MMPQLVQTMRGPKLGTVDAEPSRGEKPWAPRRGFRGVDLAEIAKVPATTLFRDRNGIAQL
jgi:hypothetical protein